MQFNLVDRFIEFHQWPTSKKSVLLMAFALPFHLVHTPIVIFASDRAGFADGTLTLWVFLASILAVCICLAASVWAYRAGHKGRWTAYLIIFVYGGWIGLLSMAYGTWSTPLLAWVPSVVILVGLWFDEVLGVVALVFAIVYMLAVILMVQVGLIPYAPILLERSIDLQANVYWAVAMLVPFMAIFTYVFATAWLTSATLKRQRDQMDQMARIDHLTGISNRRNAEEMINAVLKHDEDPRMPVSLALIDIDEFKSINDTFSHHAGDLVLKAVASVMQRSIRAADIPARLGGDEFLICFPGIGAEQARDICDELRDYVSRLQFDEPNLRATISIGVTDTPATSPEQLLRSADAALYTSKRAGRDQVTLATD